MTATERDVVISATTGRLPPPGVCHGAVVILNLALALDRAGVPPGAVAVHYEVNGERVASTSGDFGGHRDTLPRTGATPLTALGILLLLAAVGAGLGRRGPSMRSAAQT